MTILKRSMVKPLGIALLVVAAAVFPVIVGNDAFTMSVATRCLVYGLVAVTLNLLVGYGGQISLGHAGLLAVGAYTGAIIANNGLIPSGVVDHLPGGLHRLAVAANGQPVPIPLELLAAAVVTAVVGFLLGLPTGRLRGHYLAIATLGFGVAIPQIALNLDTITQGETGLTVPPATLGPLSFGAQPSPQPSLYYFVLVVVALCLAAILSMLGTRTGRAFMAVRDSEAAATAMGVNTRRTKVILFTTSAFFCGIAGDLFAHSEGLVAPASFDFSLSLLFLAMVIVGGLASVWGALAGAIILEIVSEQAANSGGLSDAIIGAVVVLMLLLAPHGLAALPRRFARFITSRRPVADPVAGKVSA